MTAVFNVYPSVAPVHSIPSGIRSSEIMACLLLVDLPERVQLHVHAAAVVAPAVSSAASGRNYAQQTCWC